MCTPLPADRHFKVNVLGIIYRTYWFNPYLFIVSPQTCVVTSMHATVMVTHGVQVVQEVLRMLACFTSLMLLLFPCGRWASEVISFDHVGRHVQCCEWEAHKSGELVSSVAHLPESLKVENENVWECPQTHLNHALLQLLAVGALPCIIWSQLHTQGTI